MAYNSHSLDALPPEVLSHIFLLSSINDSSWRYYRRLLPLTLVSSRWKSLVDADPQLWFMINIMFPLDVVETVLQKSGSTALELQSEFKESAVEVLMLVGAWYAHDEGAAMEFVQPHLWRCRTISFHFSNGQSMSWLDETEFPQLEEICINDQSYRSLNRLHLSLKLTKASLWNIRIAPTYPSLSNLRTLHLTYGTRFGPDVLDSEEILQTLRGCPVLDDCFLSNIYNPEDSTDLPGDLVVLSILRTLAFESMSTVLIYRLLRRIRAPILRMLSIHTAADEPQESPVERQRVYFSSWAAASLKSPVHADIQIGSNDLRVKARCWNGEIQEETVCFLQFSCRYNQVVLVTYLPWLVECSELNIAPTPASITLHLHWIPDFLGIDILQRLPNLHAIRIDLYNDALPTRFLNVLRSGSTDRAINAEVPFPHLVTLDLVSPWTENLRMDLMDIVRQRNRTSGILPHTLQPHLPANLEAVCLPALNSPQLATARTQLGLMLGPGKVHLAKQEDFLDWPNVWDEHEDD